MTVISTTLTLAAKKGIKNASGSDQMKSFYNKILDVLQFVIQVSQSGRK